MLCLQIDKSIQLNLCLGGCRKYIERKRVTLIRIKKFYKIFQWRKPNSSWKHEMFRFCKLVRSSKNVNGSSNTIKASSWYIIGSSISCYQQWKWYFEEKTLILNVNLFLQIVSLQINLHNSSIANYHKLFIVLIKAEYYHLLLSRMKRILKFVYNHR